MFDTKKPIEYHYNNNEWCEAVLLDSDFNGCCLIKYRKSAGSSWHQLPIGQHSYKNIRNVLETKVYRVVVVKDMGTPCIWTSIVNKSCSVGDTLNGGTIIGYHEGEYTE